MQTAHAWVEINDLHDNVQFKHITPAEALVARKQFGVKIAGQARPSNPITHLDIHTKEVERSKDQEYTRLVKKYGEKKIAEVFPGENPNIPLTFKDAGFEVAKEGESHQDANGNNKSKTGGPQDGGATVVQPLTQLPIEEITDEESVKEVAARKASQSVIEEQRKQISELSNQVSQLLAVLKPVGQPVHPVVASKPVEVPVSKPLVPVNPVTTTPANPVVTPTVTKEDDED